MNPQALAPFWASVLGVEVDGEVSDGEYVLLQPAAPGGPRVAFQRVPERKSGKTRIHLDLAVGDLDEATKAIEELGGAWIERGNTREVEGFRWRCMADPEGNEFDIATTQSA